ncbi:hypothetical protein GCM10022247_49660 [Allokutzneria multivorans]|uniref:Uncharacterized protein n=1 Tax=Allokutzneria multivorans TaxID=1142134 RepID=A0ABP7T276_9PSEU
MRKSLFAAAAVPVAVALATMGTGVATADTSAGTRAAVQQMASCDSISVLSDRAHGTCYGIAFRVGVRCESTRGNWQNFFSLWTLQGHQATATCPATWKAVSAEYDLPD